MSKPTVYASQHVAVETLGLIDVVRTQTSDAIHPGLTIERIGPASVRLLWPTNNGPQLVSDLQHEPGGQFRTGGVAAPRAARNNYAVTNSVNSTRKCYRLELL